MHPCQCLQADRHRRRQRSEQGRDQWLPEAAGGDEEDDGGPGQAGRGDLCPRGQGQGRADLSRGVQRTQARRAVILFLRYLKISSKL